MSAIRAAVRLCGKGLRRMAGKLRFGGGLDPEVLLKIRSCCM